MKTYLKTAMLLMLCLLLTTCRSRKKHVEIKNFQTSEIEKIETDSVAEIKTEAVKKIADQLKVEKTEKDISGEIEIKGKVDTIQKDFDFHNVVNGDTLSSVHISGNANFIIKNKFKQTEKKEETVKQSDSLNIVAKVARAVVSQETIKKTAEKLKGIDKNVNDKGFTFGAWLTWLAMFVFVVCAIWLFYYLGGSVNWRKILEKFK